jgi:predicted branched-subunit amino acid permease
VYSASLGRRWRDEPVWFRLVAAALIIDPTWAVAERRGDAGSPRSRRNYFLASGLALGAGWSAMIAVGAVVGGRFGGDDLQVAVPLCLVALVGPPLAKAGNWVPVVVAAFVAVAASGWPGGTGFLAAIAAGCAAGAAADRTHPARDRDADQADRAVQVEQIEEEVSP